MSDLFNPRRLRAVQGAEIATGCGGEPLLSCGGEPLMELIRLWVLFTRSLEI